MDVSSPSMRVVKPQGDASQEGYRGRLEVSPTGSIPRRENPAGKSPMTRSKPLGPSFASGKMHQRVYGHGHASPDPSVKENGDQNQISRPKVHGTRGRRRRRHDRFRLRFRLVASDFPSIVCILDRDRSSAVVLKAIGGRSRLFQGQLPSQRLPAASSAETGELAVRQSAGWRFEIGVRRPTRVNRANDRSKLPRQPA